MHVKQGGDENFDLNGKFVLKKPSNSVDCIVAKAFHPVFSLVHANGSRLHIDRCLNSIAKEGAKNALSSHPQKIHGEYENLFIVSLDKDSKDQNGYAGKVVRCNKE